MHVDFGEGKVSLVLVRTDLRYGFEKLASIASGYLDLDVMQGQDWVVFISKSRHTLKMIHADEKGSLLITRKLHHGCFQKLLSRIDGVAVKTLSKKELESYLDGEKIEVERSGFLTG